MRLKKFFTYSCFFNPYIIAAVFETCFYIETTRRLGRPQRDSKRPRPLLVRFTSELDARKSLSKAYKLKSYPVQLYFS